MYQSLIRLAFLLLAEQSTALVARVNLPPVFSVSEIGTTANPAFPDVYRDGGGGGTINGHNIVVFSDTSTTTGGATGSLKGFTSNSAAYSSSLQPTNLTDFGTNGVPRLVVPFTANESAYTDAHLGADGSRIACWPGSSIAVLEDGKTGIAIYNIAIIDHTGGGTDLYNTLLTATADDSGPSMTRSVPQLFFPGETLYGSFSNYLSPLDGRVKMFGTTENGLLLADVDPANYADRTKYRYWDGKTWTLSPPSQSSDAAYLFTARLSSGDVFYSAYFKTWITVYFNGYADNTFYIRYSLNGLSYGQWSDEQVLYETTPYSGTYNYAGHAYPGYDASGKTLVLSWTYNGGYTKMAKVTFA